jgi:ABC-type nitrate/sulfonate/bicarbonate transport system substrate-binding protein
MLLSACGGAAPAASPAPSSSAPPSAGPSAVASAKPAGSASTAASAAASGLTRVTMSFPNVDMGHLHEWVAQDLGIYRDHGLDVHDEVVSNGAAAMAALVSGQTSQRLNHRSALLGERQ